MSEFRTNAPRPTPDQVADPAAATSQVYKVALLDFQHSPSTATADAVIAAQAPFLVAIGMPRTDRARQAELLRAKLDARLAAHSEFQFLTFDFRAQEARP